MNGQCANTVLMVRPKAFGYNPDTMATNVFQRELLANGTPVQRKALREFDEMVDKLLEAGIEVIVVDDSSHPVKPDAIFPNNWFSALHTGVITVFSIMAPNRRPEKRDDILIHLSRQFVVEDVIDLGEFEADNFFLEGTGSMVMDHHNKVIYAGLSSRTSLPMLQKYATLIGYSAMPFTARDDNGNLIYHTNVMMSVGENIAIFCRESVKDPEEQAAIIQLLQATGHELIEINFDQMRAFAGNMLQVKNKKGESFLVMSTTAHASLTKSQLSIIQSLTTPLVVNIPTIEYAGGGGVRCMMAEIFLPKKETAVSHQ